MHMVAKGSKITSRRALLLFSGGLDSTTLLALLSAQGYEVQTLFFDYGQPARHAEREASRHNSEKYGGVSHEELHLPSQLFIVRGSYYPARNFVLISSAAAYAESRHIAKLFVGLVASVQYQGFSTTYPDCSWEFVETINSTLEASTTNGLVVQAPLFDVPKDGVLKLSERLGIDLADTISCLTPVKLQACGLCVSCRELSAAKNS